MILKEATWVVRTMLRKRKLKKIGNDYLSIFNQSILFNSIIKFIYKNKLNKKQWIKKYESTQSNKKKKNKGHKKLEKIRVESLIK
jgi:2-iminoacetate synthase ThiH